MKRVLPCGRRLWDGGGSVGGAATTVALAMGRVRFRVPLTAITLAGAMLTAGGGLSVQAAADPVPELLSRAAAGVAPVRTGAGPSVPGSFSGDGRYVVFASAAPDLVGLDPNGSGWDVFRRDLTTGRTEVVSAVGASTWDGQEPSISRDGRVVAFVSRRAVPGAVSSLSDTNGLPDVVVRRMPQEGVLVVSVRADGTGTGNGASGGAQVSAGGGWVVFESESTDLTSGLDANGETDVFLRGLEGGVTVRVSSVGGGAPGERAAGGGRSYAPLMGGEGEVVVFRSDAGDLAPRPAGNVTDLHVWTRASGTVRRVVLPGDPVVTGTEVVRVSNVVMSGDGRHIAFRALTTRVGVSAADGVWVVDLVTDTATRIGETRDGTGVNGVDDTTGPVISGDGGVVAFEVSTGLPPGGPRRQVRVWRAETGTLSLDAAAAGGTGAPAEPEVSEMPVLDAAGTRLAYMTPSAVPGTAVTEAGPRRLVVRELATGKTAIVPSGSELGSGELPCAEFHPDGTRLLFLSALPLGAGVEDGNRAFDVFVGEPGGAAPEVVSVADAGVLVASVPGGAVLAPGGVSGDGRFVLVGMQAGGLSGGPRQVFRVDRTDGSRLLVSRDGNGAAGVGASTPVALSNDGRSALILSAAANLVAGDTNAVEDLFRVELPAGGTTLVSAKDGGFEFGNRAALAGAVASADGRWVAFLSTGLDLVPGLSGTGNNLFLRDTVERRTLWLTRNDVAEGITGVQGQARRVVIGESGQLVAFLAGVSAASGSVYLYDQRDGSRRRVPVNAVHAFAVSEVRDGVAVVGTSADGTGVGLHVLGRGATATEEILRLRAGSIVRSLAFSADGRALVFSTAAPVPVEVTGVADTNGARDVFHYEFATGKVRVCSLDGAGGFGVAPSELPVISGDGQRVAFRVAPSQRTSGPGDPAGREGARVRVFEVGTGRTTDLVPAGAGPEAYATTPVISRDGGTVVLMSSGGDWSVGDGNGLADVFAFRVVTGDPGGGGDSDGDGLPDAWELEFLGGLAAGADADPDADGASNGAEYQAGTHPMLAGDVFRVGVAPAGPGVGGIVVVWESVSGLKYQAETAATVSGGVWSVVPGVGEITGDGFLKAVTVPTGQGGGFVRLRVRR